MMDSHPPTEITRYKVQTRPIQLMTIIELHTILFEKRFISNLLFSPSQQ